VLWGHWFASAVMHGGSAVGFRIERLLLCALSACAFLLLLTELGVGRLASLCAVALACWSGYRSEIWRQFGMPEALGMPYALLSLWCAVRASRPNASIGWDIGSSALFLGALGIKNTYVALAPALLWLRFTGAGVAPWLLVWRSWPRALFYVIPALLPVLQFVSLKFRPTHADFQTRFALAHGVNLLAGVWEAMHPKRMGVAFAVVLITGALLALLRRNEGEPTSLWERPFVQALGAALLLLAAGAFVYMPWPYCCGRYTMPAVWGADILFALLLSTAREARPLVRVGVYGAAALGLLLVGFDTLKLQDRQADLLVPMWDAIHYLEEAVPESAAMRTGEDGEFTEGERIHFSSHLSFRGWAGLTSVGRLESLPTAEVVLTRTVRPPGGNYVLARRFQRTKGPRGGPACYVWRKAHSSTE
jgi:hypothetical protein